MRMLRLIVVLAFLFLFRIGFSQQKSYRIHTLAFYNFENLFDTINNPDTNDDEWTPKGTQRWTSKKYHQKLENLARVVLEIGTAENANSPTFIACSEIENRGVLEDLVQQPKMAMQDYGIIHFDSPDKRGIDVALLFQKKYFKPTSYANIPLYIYQNKTQNQETASTSEEQDDEVVNTFENRVFTRDQLLVTGFLDGEEINIIVNHWPSRAGGEKKSSQFREAAGILNRKIIDSLQKINPDAKVITLGDLNDSPFNNSIKKALDAKSQKQEVPEFGIYNPFEEMAKKGLGTIAFRDSWDIFDQIMVTKSLIKNDFSTYQYWKAGIFNKSYLIQSSGQYKGYPKRHSATEVGFSDHFPVYIYLIKETK
ncbi:endonuclease/exonuclease/phosphatase family protein [Flavobacterium sufflavum]|uniref:Endonuclease/exonuclease/phosphatase family protein n=1 Tax=Flavobacterium sufflavum TaxID=1921138 RepID=A0A437KZN9_9FLAO|nr:endonuclease/exonuclease/phosphatase family protein [Flavobacterium sufflavum]RVT78206.1 endonuclease/exonuclease/phosphatase family protein [Flavobacterium sufflavum]